MTTNQSTSASAPGRHYLHNLFDNARWQEVELRAGDIVVCTSYKSGTTWTQMVCALLVHQSPQLPRSLAELSPWVDARFSSIDNIAAALKAQSHTRIIKTHTPLDGLPRQAGVRYLFCGREPRDVFMSLQNHLANANRERIVELLADQGITYRGGELPESLDDRFALWITRGTFPWENDGAPFWSHLAHAQSFWDCRDDAALHFLHYADLKHDLEGEMRRLAELLDVSVDEALWPALVKAATFEDMKKNADMTAPDTNHGVWQSNAQFFNKGTNEQWRGQLSEESLALYQRCVYERYDAAMLRWLEQGSLVAGRPNA